MERAILWLLSRQICHREFSKGEVHWSLKSRVIEVSDKIQQGYSYELSEPIGANFHPEFRPQLTPKEMLELGVFGGKYMTDCTQEFPADWFELAKLSPDRHESGLNFYGVSASKPLAYWQTKGWIYGEDPRGWFQWYCRYYLGRRCQDDERQVKRWLAMRRHVAQLVKNCQPGDYHCRPRQRQALLQWAYDSREM